MPTDTIPPFHYETPVPELPIDFDNTNQVQPEMPTDTIPPFYYETPVPELPIDIDNTNQVQPDAPTDTIPPFYYETPVPELPVDFDNTNQVQPEMPTDTIPPFHYETPVPELSTDTNPPNYLQNMNTIPAMAQSSDAARLSASAKSEKKRRGTLLIAVAVLGCLLAASAVAIFSLAGQVRRLKRDQLLRNEPMRGDADAAAVPKTVAEAPAPYVILHVTSANCDDDDLIVVDQFSNASFLYQQQQMSMSIPLSVMMGTPVSASAPMTPSVVLITPQLCSTLGMKQ
jgi:uncharacterized membrane protein